MDTSETRIKMCNCAEIQDIAVKRVVADGGWLRTSAVGSFVNAIAKDGEVFTFINSDYVDIWLPTQAQLQEMVPTKTGSTQPNFRMISELNHFYDYWDTSGIPNFLTTWGQLWLAFVMKEKHNKVWDGEKWESC